MLNAKQIRYLIELTQQKTVTQFDGYTVTQRGGGYSKDPEVAAIQGALSIMLEAATRAE